MEESFDQKVIRNIQNKFAVYKTTEVVGIKSSVPNLEWTEADDVDKFFAFASNLGARVIYITEADEEDEDGNLRNTIVQVGFIYQGIMHHINLLEDEDKDEESDEYEDEELDTSSDEIIYDKNSSDLTKETDDNLEYDSQINNSMSSKTIKNNNNDQYNNDNETNENNNNNNNNSSNDFIGNF